MPQPPFSLRPLRSVARTDFGRTCAKPGLRPENGGGVTARGRTPSSTARSAHRRASGLRNDARPASEAFTVGSFSAGGFKMTEPKRHRRKGTVWKEWPFRNRWSLRRIGIGEGESNKQPPMTAPIQEGTHRKSQTWRRCRPMLRKPLRPTPPPPMECATIHCRSDETAFAFPLRKGRPDRF